VSRRPPAGAGDASPAPLPTQGPKEVVRGRRAVAASQSPIVTGIMLDVLEAGGNAVDAAVAGCIAEGTVQIDMTNHTGTVCGLVYQASSDTLTYLNSMGTLHPGLPPFRTYPPAAGGLASGGLGVPEPMACIPGFMPGVGALHERFGSLPWASLVEHSIPWAEDGFPVDEFTRSVLEWELEGNIYFPEMRALYAPRGFTPSVGEKLRNPALAQTLRRLADEGPAYFTTGEWAQHFVAKANDLGWKIELADLSAAPPRWCEPLRYTHNGHEIVQPPPPERQGVYCALVLGVLEHLGVSELGHYSESAESLYYMGQALRRAHQELAHLHDPEFFEVPLDVWMSDDYHAALAAILKRSRPKPGVDLTTHVELTSAACQLGAFGWIPSGGSPDKEQPTGSCELVCVDARGDWVQLMTTLQSGGIPGMVVDGVPMVGSHVGFGMQWFLSGWLGLPGSRMRSVISSTMVLHEGRPRLSLGSPGNVHCTVPQLLCSLLDFPNDPYDAAVLPRMLPMRDDYTVDIEARVPEAVARDIARLGARLAPRPPFDLHMGSFQQAWRDPETGLMSASTDPRRAGEAGGL
jgi:gamma-glutamyltranspeptidase/glutathione hydrolase